MSNYFYNKELDIIRLKLSSNEIDKLEEALRKIAEEKKDTANKSELSPDDIRLLEKDIDDLELTKEQKQELNSIVAVFANKKVHKEINAQVFIEQERLRIYEFYLNLKRQFHKARQFFTAIIFIAILLVLVESKYGKLNELFKLNSCEIIMLGVLLLLFVCITFGKYLCYIINRCTVKKRIKFMEKAFSGQDKIKSISCQITPNNSINNDINIFT